MKLRAKLFLIFGASYMLVFMALFATTNAFTMRGFINLEDASIEKQVSMGVHALELRIGELEEATHGYAAWDNSYYFIQSNITQFIDRILLGSAFVDSRLSFMVFLDARGRVAYSKAFDVMQLSIVPFPSSVMDIILREDALRLHDRIDGRVSGVMSAPEGLFIVSSQPILTSEMKGPIAGTLVCGRFLDQLEVQQLEEATFLSLRLLPLDALLDDPKLADVASRASGGETVVVERPDDETILGYSAVKGVFDEPVMLMEVEAPRDVYMHSLMMVAYFAVVSILVGIIIAFVALIAMNRLVLSPLLKLSKEVNEIDPHAMELRNVIIQGDDEVSALSSNIDNMLKALNQYQRRLKETERMATIGETAAMVGHDLRNPLQVVYLLSARLRKRIELLTGRVEDEDVKELEFIEDRLKAQTVYMDKIISDLQDFSKSVSLSIEEADLEKLVTEILSSLTIPEGINVSTSFDERLRSVHADGGLMRRVFTNLLTNAVQAMPEGGFLMVEGSVVNGNAKVAVSDTGVGISEEDTAKIFRPLFTTKAKGTGLGLAVCKKLVEAHGGEISFGSKKGVGTTFNVVIPLVHEGAPPAEAPRAEATAAVPTDRDPQAGAVA
jgi:signal transduction histidine kinase